MGGLHRFFIAGGGSGAGWLKEGKEFAGEFLFFSFFLSLSLGEERF